MMYVFFPSNLRSAPPTPPILYVAADGSGDYNCDGTSDQVEINAALDAVAADPSYTTVYLKGPNTYWIDEPIVISSNTILTGDPTAKIQLIDNTDWPDNKPLIRQYGDEHWNGDLIEGIYGTADDYVENVEISGFEITAGNQNASTGGYKYILMIFYHASNLKIHDMNMHGSYGDIVRVTSLWPSLSENMEFYNNHIEHSGHDGFYIRNASDVDIYDNEIYHTRTNDGIRLRDVSDISVYGNTIGNDLTKVPSGYAGIYIKNKNLGPVSIEIYDNYIFGKAGGIVLTSELSGNPQYDIHIHHNRMYKIFDNTAGGSTSLNGGIHIYGFNNTLIELNTIDGSQKDGIIYEMGTQSGTGFQTIVSNNNITNCTGYALNNTGGTDHSFVSNYNNLYNNTAGNYHDASSTTDINVDPLYANATGLDPDAIDFHLKSEYGRWNGSAWVNDLVTSQCIDAGDPTADFSLEPSENGGRVNIGVFGNTIYASKSTSPVPVVIEYFSANLINNNIILKWRTATEVNNYGFEIQKSLLNGQSSKFETIGFVDGHGNSNSPKEYTFVDTDKPGGTVQYRLKQIDIDGEFEYSDIVEVNNVFQKEFKLLQNYPNPFNPTTVIEYSIPKASHVSIKVFDILGKEVATLVNKNQENGSYKVQFNATKLSNGTYFYKIKSGDFTEIKKMLLLK